MKRLGPELKMPALKAPTFLVDLWWDLWDRRLLPLVVLVVAAIVAVPFLMGSGSKEVPQSSLAALPGAGGAAPTAANASDLTVVEAKPGLRDYRKRLRRLTPTDPFKQRFASPRITANLGGEGSGGSTTTTTTTTTGGGGESGGEAGGGGNSEPAPSGAPSESSEGETGGAPSSGGEAKPHLIFYAFAINVRISRSGGNEAEGEGEQKPEASVKKRVLPLTPLPGEKAPVVTYMGPSRKGKVLLLVSNNVRSISGEGKCVLGDVPGEVSGEVAGEGACQLLEVEPGFPDTFVYGANEVHYTIKLLKIEVVIVGRT